LNHQFELKFCSEKQSERKLFDMSGNSDAVWIVEELLDEILERIILRDMETENIERETHEMSEKEWIKLIDADMKELLGKCFIERLGHKAENTISEEMDEQMKEVIVDEENMNLKDSGTKKEKKFPEYKAMSFNWKEVDPIFKG